MNSFELENYRNKILNYNFFALTYNYLIFIFCFVYFVYFTDEIMGNEENLIFPFLAYYALLSANINTYSYFSNQKRNSNFLEMHLITVLFPLFFIFYIFIGGKKTNFSDVSYFILSIIGIIFLPFVINSFLKKGKENL